ncbi:MAG: NADH dehydrogenase (quinone) subunit D [Thermoleophilia bacterium]
MAGHDAHPAPVKARPTPEELKERKLRSRQRVLGNEETIKVSMGPQHPSTHGVYQAMLELDGEIIVSTDPRIGNLHRGVEKLAENRSYHQVIPLTDRLDYISSFAMNHAYCEAVEKLMDLEVPRRARYIRTIADEMCRISNHLLWLGVHVMDFGAQTFFLICFRDREYILDLFEELCGARLTHSYARIGGVAADLPEGWIERCRAVVDFLPKRLAEYQRLVENNRIFKKRTVGIGIFTVDDCMQWRVTGPALRAAGVARDLRKDEPFAAYDEIDFEVAVEYDSDVYARYLVRMKEMYESCNIIRRALEQIPDGDVIAEEARSLTIPRKKNVMRDAAAMVQDFVQVFRGPKIPKGEVYKAIEVPKGEMGVYIVSDGGPKPQRLRLTTPTFYHCQATPALFEGEMIADVVGIFGSVDIVLGDSDR